MDHTESIKKITADHFNINVDLLSAKTRKREVVIARQSAIVVMKEFTSLSLKSIGYLFGKRDHSTVIHSFNAVQDMIDTDKDYAHKLVALKERIIHELQIGLTQPMPEDQIDKEFIHLL